MTSRLTALARRDPGAALLLIALALVVLVYAAAVPRGLVNYDDTWLVGDNFFLQRTSWSTLHAIFFDTTKTTRFLLGAEYLPVRDVSVVLDFAIWGTWYPGHHLTNLVIYLAALVAWFSVLDHWGIDRKLVGLAILLWALHPTHAESVAWLSERKGLLALLWSGLAGLGYVRFRAGGSYRSLVFAMLATALAVWSKATSAFTIAAFLGFDLALPAARMSWRRSLGGLAALGVVGVLAFVPVLKTATNLAVVTTDAEAPAGWLAMVLGGHGFYVEQAAMAFRNAVSYPISTAGPSGVQIAIGAVALALVAALAFAPGRWKRDPTLQVGAWLWLLGWFPASRIVLPLKLVLFADRYALVSTLGFSLIVASLLLRLGHGRARAALIATIMIAASLRTFDAQSNWRNSATLWQRATISNPGDGVAWSSYAEALETAGEDELALDAVRLGLRNSRSPRLLLRKALLVLAHGQRPQALKAMREAAEAGEPRAMSNLSYLLLQDGRADEALDWGRRAVATAPMYPSAHRNLGAAALATKHVQEAYEAFLRAYELWPFDAGNRYNLAVALVQLGRRDEAQRHLAACVWDPVNGAKARALLAQIIR
jgi:tetratricopeptide (TPR) repeat protein